MTLVRTTSGLRNLHLFHGVDYIVFVEGGKSIDYEAIVSSGGDLDTNDVFFWQGIFAKRQLDRNLHFKSVGAKPLLKKILSEIIDNEIFSILVCMDRDFDNFSNTICEDRRAIYTFGYSWENDVYGDEVIDNLFFSHCTKNQKSIAAHKSLSESIREFDAAVRDFISIERLLVRNDETRDVRLFPRTRPLRCVVQNKGQRPTLDEVFLEKVVEDLEMDRGRLTAGQKKAVKPRVDVFGHLLAQFIYHSFRHFLEGAGRKLRLSVEDFGRAAISEFKRAFDSKANWDVKLHYIEAVKAAFLEAR